MTGRLEEKGKSNNRKNTGKGRKRNCKASLMSCSQLSMPDASDICEGIEK